MSDRRHTVSGAVGRHLGVPVFPCRGLARCDIVAARPILSEVALTTYQAKEIHRLASIRADLGVLPDIYGQIYAMSRAAPRSIPMGAPLLVRLIDVMRNVLCELDVPRARRQLALQCLD